MAQQCLQSWGATVHNVSGTIPSRVARLASFTAFFSTLLIYSPNVMVLQSFDRAILTGYFAEPYLVCAFVAAVVIGVLAYRYGFRFDEIIGCRAAVVGSCALYVIATIGYMLVVMGAPSLGSVLAVVCALGVGVTLIPVVYAWSRVLSDLDLCAAVLMIALVGGATALINLALMYATPVVAGVLFSALTLAGVIYPLANVAAAEKPAVLVAVPATEPPSALHLKAFFSVMGMSLLGMVISSFAMGVQPVFLFGNAIDAQRVGMLVGCVALLPLAYMRNKQPIYTFIYQVYLPVAAAAALVLCVLLATDFARDVALAGVYAFYCMVSGVAVAATCAIANAREFSRGFVFAALIGSFCASGLLGIFLGARIQSLAASNGMVLVILTALYGCGMLLVGCIKSWRLIAHPSGSSQMEACDGGSGSGVRPETFEDRLARVASEASLSPRETQIVGYVGRGHSSVYVAKTLLISESTVYSHVRNVYRKLGVSSREELIQLLNAPASSEANAQ